MSNKGHDIEDDEIRIISSNQRQEKMPKDSEPRNRRGLFLAIAACLVAAVVLLFVMKGCGASDVDGDSDAEYPVVEDPPVTKIPPITASDSLTTSQEVDPAPATQDIKSFITRRDTVVAGARLTVYTPVDAVASLAIGDSILRDSTVIMAFQAADIRADNGQIVSAFVDRGELVSTGQSKAGFCAIIDGKITIGVADVTMYFEQALTSGGYFFRQYPLVVGNQVIENKPKGRSLRKALAELKGRVVVITSRNELTFGEFSNAMVDMGVSTAIYLVGAKSSGIVRLEDGETIEYNIDRARVAPEYTNFIVWK